MWRFTLAREISVGKPLSGDLLHCQLESLRIRQFTFVILPIVIAEHLLIHVTRQMKGFYGNVGSTKRTLKQTPEIFHAVDVDTPAHVRLSLVDKLMNESALQAIVVADRVVRVHGASVL